MKKNILVLILICCFCSGLLSQTTINVPSQYSTIQQAINHAFSLTGSITIQVNDGDYDKFEINYLPIIITDLTIESTNGNTDCSIISNYEGSVVKIIGSSNITISGFTIENAGQLNDDDGHGVSIKYSNSVNIESCIIRNNISAGNGGGIYVSSCWEDIYVSDCHIYNNDAEIYGGGIYYSDSKGFISNNNIYANNAVFDGGGIHCRSKEGIVPFLSVEISGNEIFDNTSNGGGGIGITCIDRNYLIVNNTIRDNITTDLVVGDITYLASGGGIRTDGNTDVVDNLIMDNESETWGGGITCREKSSEHYNYIPNISKNIIMNNASLCGGGLFIDQGIVNVTNCTIVGNSASEHGGGVGLDHEYNPLLEIHPFFNNCIIWGNTVNGIPNQIYSSADYVEKVEIGFSCIEGGQNGVSGNTEILVLNNITGANPQFADPLNGDYYLTDASPCVDTGDPTYPADPDGTTIDMGRYYYPHPDYDIHRLSKGYNWESFPRIELLNNNNDETNIIPILSNINPFDDITSIIFDAKDEYDLTYDGFSWSDNPYLAQSSWLYKIEVLPNEERLLLVEGAMLADDFTLEDEDPLEAGEYHWLGFWLPRNQKMIESFGSNWDDVDKVKSEDWLYSPANNQRGDPTYPIVLDAEDLILEPGKGYMVLFKENTSPITNFHWTLSGAAEEPEKKSEPENFTYTEKADYEAIDVFNIPSNVTEIGIFEEDVCIGAVVVEDSCAQILAYSSAMNRDPVPFTFEFVTGRGLSTPIKDYQVLNLQTGEFETKSIFSSRQEYSVMRFGDEEELEENTPLIPQLYGNYPNPFNPNTTISFSLPEEQKMELSIYNIKGQKVKQLINGQFTAGQHSMVWDGKDTNGKSVSTGIYFYRLKAGNKELSRKMLLLK